MFLKNRQDAETPEIKEIKELCEKMTAASKKRYVFRPIKKLNIKNSEIDFIQKYIAIGLNGFGLNQNKKTDFVLLILIIYHEFQHLLQIENINAGKADSSFVFSHISQVNNYYYYHSKYNHSVNMLELDADRGGVRGAYAYIKKHHPEIDAISILKKILLDRDMYADHVSDIDKINTVEDFDTYLFIPIAKELKSKIKTFDGCEKDEFSKYMDRYWYETGDNPKSDVLVSSADNINLLCDKLVASITVELHPEYEELCIKNGVPVPKFEDVLLEIKGLAKEERDV